MSKPSSTRPFASATVFVLSLGLLLGITGCGAPSTSVEPMMSGARLDPPPQGRNKIWIEFQDQTAQGGGFEDTMFDKVQEAASQRGYKITRFPAEADYVMWATLRRFQRVGNGDDLEDLVEELGDVAGPMDEPAPGSQLAADANDPSKTTDLVGSGMASGFTKMVTATKIMVMVCDLQVGTRRDGDAAEGVGEVDTATSASAVREGFYLQSVQRLLASAKGSGLKEPEARTLLVPRIVDAIKTQLPRYRGN